MVQKLNLNHPELTTDRQDMIEMLDDQLNAGDPPERLRQDFLGTDRDGARPSFANVAIEYLKAQANVQA